MKLITFAIPCYNSEEYMEKCIDSLLEVKDDIEIIIVDDGSTDKTLKIANSYQKKYHGSAVNVGLENATGLYYKVVDSDDWVDKESLIKVLKTIKKLKEEKNLVDMMIVNYVYEKVGAKKR